MSKKPTFSIKSSPPEKSAPAGSSQQFDQHKEENMTKYEGQAGPILVSRSLKKKMTNMDLSFEEDSLEEHFQAIEKFSKKYLRGCLKNQQIMEQLSFAAPGLFDAGVLPLQYSQGLNLLNNKLFSAAQRAQFEKDLENEDKFRAFLGGLKEKYPEPIANEFIYISYRAWEAYLKAYTPFIKLEGWMNEGEHSAEAHSAYLFHQCGLEFLNVRRVNLDGLASQEEVLVNFRKFISQFICTVFLIIEQYFENPYSQKPKQKKTNNPYFPKLLEEMSESSQYSSSYSAPTKHSKHN